GVPVNNIKSTADVSLKSILRRSDVWRGDSKRFATQHRLDTGYSALNKALLVKGWPLGDMLEVCQPVSYGHSEWLLLAPALRKLHGGYIVLLNPPAIPFCQGILQMGLDLNRIVVVQSAGRGDFLKSFVELARAKVCRALLAWSPNVALSYTDLRKCLLACSTTSLTVLFRHRHALQQSSPAGLRLACEVNAQGLAIDIRKQKGLLAKRSQVINLPLPRFTDSTKASYWQPSDALPKPFGGNLN
nr:hypothetical protein [Cellvibrionaceae bacterium]